MDEQERRFAAFRVPEVDGCVRELDTLVAPGRPWLNCRRLGG